MSSFAKDFVAASMKYIFIFLMALGFSTDAFAVSVCKGVKMKKLYFRNIFVISLFFGGFQMLMPCLGYLLGNAFIGFLSGFSHWISFSLLAFIGTKMCIEALGKATDDTESDLDFKELFALSVATSIDALAGGFTLAASKDINVLLSVAIIGAVTFSLCSLGVILGHSFGSRFKSKAEFFGGSVLIGLGIKLLLDGILP